MRPVRTRLNGLHNGRLALILLMSSSLCLGSPKASKQKSEDSEEAAATVDETSAPGKIQFERMTHEFGDVYRGEKIKFRFSFVNAGDGPLVIQGIHAACGCLATEAEKGRPFKPGESGEIEVTLDTTNFVGPITKVITVMTNERLIPDRALTVRALIREELALDPPLADFGDVQSKDVSEQQISIKPIGNAAVEPTGIRFNKDVLEATLTKDPSKKLWTVKIKLLTAPKTGFLKETVFLRTNSTHTKELPILVRANLKGSIEAFPQYLEFGAISKGEKSKRSVTLKIEGDYTLNGSKTILNINGEPFKDVDPIVKISPVQESGGKKVFTIELTNPANASGAVHGKMLLETTDPRQKELPVDFYAYFR